MNLFLSEKFDSNILNIDSFNVVSEITESSFPLMYLDQCSFLNLVLPSICKSSCWISVISNFESEETTRIGYFYNSHEEYERISGGCEREEENIFGYTVSSSFSLKAALYLDRDGILIKDTEYPHKIEEVEFIDEIVPILEFAKKNDIPIIVVTNQSGIARGFYDLVQYQVFTNHIQEYFKVSYDIEFEDIYFCPFHLDGKVEEFARASLYRKPNPGMFLKAAQEKGLNIEKSLMIGDRPTDRINGINLRSIIINQNSGSDVSDHESLLQEVKKHFENFG